MDDNGKPIHKAHNKTRAGRGAREKKRQDNSHLKNNRNNRSHGVANVGKAKRQIQRNSDKSHQKEYVPKDDRSKLVTSASPPLVVVMGPKGVGKSMLIRSLVKYYSNTNLTDPTGPITCKTHTGRVTFMECPNDVSGMLDTAKIADLVLLVVDAKFGFEMETFEYLNILQTHGFTKVAGIFTHLDQFEKLSMVKKTKKLLKQRFWGEIYQGSKMFYLSGVINGKYLKNEIRLLGMWIQRCKYRPLSWRNNHPYLLVDRIDDITYPNNEDKDDDARVVAFYGYLRGTNLTSGASVHIPGVGDFAADQIKALNDPLPLLDDDGNKLKTKAKLYAPGSDYMTNADDDEGGLYIDLPRLNYSKPDHPKLVNDKDTDGDDDEESTSEEEEDHDNVKLMKSLQALPKKKDVKFRIFKGGDVLHDQSDEESVTTPNNEAAEKDIPVKEESGDESSSCPSDSDDDSSDTSSDEDDELEGEGRARRATDLFLDRSSNLQDLIYGTQDGGEDEEEESDSEESSDEFFKLKKSSNPSTHITKEDTTRSQGVGKNVENDIDFDELRDKFVTGNWGGEVDEDSDVELHGDFEDLENPNNNPTDENEQQLSDEQLRELNAKKKSEHKAETDEAEEKAGDEEENIQIDELGKLKEELIAQKKARLEDLKGGMKFTGFHQGQYVKIVLTGIPSTFRTKISKTPVLIGGLPNLETGTGIVQVRIKKHRWFERILKSKDALIISAGWRRFQTLPVYYMDEDNGRHRFLKYTPEHMHCNMQYSGHLLPTNTGLCCFRRLDNVGGFRVVATGVTLGNTPSTSIVKKLKLTGTPYKIYKNTCYIKGMFNSNLEVERFIGAKIRSVSGIRGQVKKALNEGQPGTFRATFEDKVKLSDIVFIRTWMPVDIPQLNLPILNHCDAQLMRTKAQLSHDTKTPIEVNPDSIYKPIVRPNIKPTSLKVPKSIQSNLPFKSKPKNTQGFSKKGYVKNRKAVVLDKDQKAKISFIDALGAIKNASKSDKKIRNAAKIKEKARMNAKIDAAKEAARKIMKKRQYRAAGKAEAAKRAKVA